MIFIINICTDKLYKYMYLTMVCFAHTKDINFNLLIKN